MTNLIAICIAVVVALVFVADAIWFGGQLPILTGKALYASVEYLSFWR